MKVILMQDDIDYVDEKKQIGVAIFPFDESFDLEDGYAREEYLWKMDCVERVYGQGEQNAWELVRNACAKHQYDIVLEI